LNTCVTSGKNFPNIPFRYQDFTWLEYTEWGEGKISVALNNIFVSKIRLDKKNIERKI